MRDASAQQLNSDRETGLAPATVAIDPGYGWSLFTSPKGTCWFKGHYWENGRSISGSRATQALLDILDPKKKNHSSSVLAGLDGHFAVVVQRGSVTLAAVDRIRSTPLFFDQTTVTAQPRRHAAAVDLDLHDMDPLAVSAFALSGYTIGATTLFPAIAELAPGEAVILGDGNALRWRYRDYRPHRAVDAPWRGDLQRQLRDVTLGILDALAKSADGRPILVPLSGGLDSRLVVSGLHHVGYRNVRCFSYGQPGNLEAVVAKKVADHLGYDWEFVPSRQAALRAFYTSDLNADYTRYADTLSSLPVNVELPYLAQLRETSFAPAESVLINGQSGDFIAGAHIPTPLNGPGRAASLTWQDVFASYCRKHLDHWKILATKNQLAPIETRLRQMAEAISPDLSGERLPFVYEALEFENRQTKYVITGQRVYDYLGFDWRLPLWDPAYLDFWERVPLHAKRGQVLYRKMLNDENWGGVWSDEYARRYIVTPTWIRPLRWALKVLCAPFGKACWHDIERQYLFYWMQGTCAFAYLPYWRVARDRRGFRSAMSWRIESYLNEKGLRLEDCGVAA